MAKDDEVKKTDEAAEKAEDEALDPEIEAIAKDPKAVKALLEAKRAANAEAKKLRLKQEELAKTEQAKQDELLKEQGKFKELAEKHKAEAEKARAEKVAAIIDFRLEIAAVQAGAIDAEDVMKLIDRSPFKLGEDGRTVEGVKEAVDALKTSKPHLFKSDVKLNPAQVKSESKASLKSTVPGADRGESPDELLARGIASKK